MTSRNHRCRGETLRNRFAECVDAGVPHANEPSTTLERLRRTTNKGAAIKIKKGRKKEKGESETVLGRTHRSMANRRLTGRRQRHGGR